METESIDRFFQIMGNISSYLLFVGFIGTLAHIFKKGIFKISGIKVSLGLIAVVTTLLTVIITFLALEIVQMHALKKVQSILNQPVIELKVNGKGIDSINQQLVLNELKNMKKVMAHNSHPVNNIVIEIYSQKDTVKLEVGKDSDIENEYWIFWNRYRATTDNDFARVKTKIFENIQ